MKTFKAGDRFVVRKTRNNKKVCKVILVKSENTGFLVDLEKGILVSVPFIKTSDEFTMDELMEILNIGVKEIGMQHALLLEEDGFLKISISRKNS